jgi:two-component system LytT family response regulator
MKNYVAIFCDGHKTLVYTSMKELEDRLPARQFIRVHKSFIIPVNKIAGIEGNLLRLKNVTSEIFIGDSHRSELMELVQNKMIQ